jgi:cytochrome bd ubiquinol oxidase subunit I
MLRMTPRTSRFICFLAAPYAPSLVAPEDLVQANFWLRIFALSFAMGVVTGIVVAFQFGTNWSRLSERMK